MSGLLLRLARSGASQAAALGDALAAAQAELRPAGAAAAWRLQRRHAASAAGGSEEQPSAAQAAAAAPAPDAPAAQAAALAPEAPAAAPEAAKQPPKQAAKPGKQQHAGGKPQQARGKPQHAGGKQQQAGAKQQAHGKQHTSAKQHAGAKQQHAGKPRPQPREPEPPRSRLSGKKVRAWAGRQGLVSAKGQGLGSRECCAALPGQAPHPLPAAARCVQVSELPAVQLGSYFDVPQGLLPEAEHEYYRDPVLKVRLDWFVLLGCVHANGTCIGAGAQLLTRARCSGVFIFVRLVLWHGQWASVGADACTGVFRRDEPGEAALGGCGPLLLSPVAPGLLPALPRPAQLLWPAHPACCPQGENVHEPNYGCRAVQQEWEWSGRRSLMARACMRDIAAAVEASPPAAALAPVARCCPAATTIAVLPCRRAVRLPARCPRASLPAACLPRLANACRRARSLSCS